MLLSDIYQRVLVIQQRQTEYGRYSLCSTNSSSRNGKPLFFFGGVRNSCRRQNCPVLLFTMLPAISKIRTGQRHANKLRSKIPSEGERGEWMTCCVIQKYNERKWQKQICENFYLDFYPPFRWGLSKLLNIKYQLDSGIEIWSPQLLVKRMFS